MLSSEIKVSDGVLNMVKDNLISVATMDQVRLAAEGLTLEDRVKTVLNAAKDFREDVRYKYGYPRGAWFPCGFSSIRLSWSDLKQRELIKLFRRLGRKNAIGSYEGFFGYLGKDYPSGFLWDPQLIRSQSMLFKEEVNNFIRMELAKANIAVSVKSVID